MRHGSDPGWIGLGFGPADAGGDHGGDRRGRGGGALVVERVGPALDAALPVRPLRASCPARCAAPDRARDRRARRARPRRGRSRDRRSRRPSRARRRSACRRAVALARTRAAPRAARSRSARSAASCSRRDQAEVAPVVDVGAAPPAGERRGVVRVEARRPTRRGDGPGASPSCAGKNHWPTWSRNMPWRAIAGRTWSGHGAEVLADDRARARDATRASRIASSSSAGSAGRRRRWRAGPAGTQYSRNSPIT